MFLYAVAIFLVILCVWYFFLHRWLSGIVFTRVTTKPLAVRMLSIVTLLAAIIIIWQLAGISVLAYWGALLRQGTP